MSFAGTKRIRVFLLLSIVLLSAGCGSNSRESTSGSESDSCVFTNPVHEGQDPWVVRQDGVYYFVESRDGGLYVSRSENLTEVTDNPELVWTPPDSGWNQANLWAPELHYYEGRWYIHYAAGSTEGSPFTSQRSGVLESVTGDPQGEYIDRGMVYTGDNIRDGSENIWAIDMTLMEINDQLYGVWSGWEENRRDDNTPQHLYIAEMENPATVSSNRVRISSPEEEWETGSELAINEAPQVLKRDNEVFIMYSASESWLPAYNLGQLRLTGDDPMNPENWEKSGPVFEGNEDVHGVGHASFTTSPDGEENWIAYHTKASPDPGWYRVVHLQPFGWNEDGTPDFGRPVPIGETLARPSGDCE